MFEFKQGNLLEEKAEALVNTVNCVGVMGKGIALQFKQAYPENFRHYEKACKANEVQPGRMFTVATGSLLNPRYIINFPTKRHWRNNSKIEDIKSGLWILKPMSSAIARLKPKQQKWNLLLVTISA
ncbi:macro domain-containing protein [Nostoc sp.]|uniref:macro domain-containing protein n=1 Tax=Nostoc sp. TaxID=1180 RepID=UPI0035939788